MLPLFLCIATVPLFGLGPLSILVILRPHDVVVHNYSVLVHSLDGHSVEIKCSSWELKCDGLILLPQLPFRLNDHALETLKLLPFSTLTTLINPCPVQEVNIIEGGEFI